MPSYTATVAFEVPEDLDWLEVHHIEQRLSDAMHRGGFDEVAINVEEVDGVEADGDSESGSTAESGTSTDSAESADAESDTDDDLDAHGAD